MIFDFVVTPSLFTKSKIIIRTSSIQQCSVDTYENYKLRIVVVNRRSKGGNRGASIHHK
jgi:hypothetical protein